MIGHKTIGNYLDRIFSTVIGDPFQTEKIIGFSIENIPAVRAAVVYVKVAAWHLTS